MKNGIQFRSLDVTCRKDPGGFFDDDVIVSSCFLKYSLRRPWTAVGIILLIAGILAGLALVFGGYKWWTRPSRTASTTPSPTVIHSASAVTASKPAKAPAPLAPEYDPSPAYPAASYYPPPVYSTTTVYDASPVQSQFGYNNNGYEDTHVSIGVSGTTFR